MDTPTVSVRVGELLRAAGETVALAESSTGGLVSSMLTDVPGSSAYFDRGLVTYSNGSKEELLGVERETLVAHGAVSEPTARAMARGVCVRSGTDWGLSTTGVAGPEDTPQSPAGTVHVAVARRVDEAVTVTEVGRHRFDGTREECKRRFARRALERLQAALEANVDDAPATDG